jgi:hypothetical protein
MTTQSTTRATYDVIPNGGGWTLKMAGDSVSEWHASKDEAVRRARELGRAYGTWRVRVYAASGALEQELTSSSARAPSGATPAAR